MSIEELRKRYAVVPPVVLCAGCHAVKGKELYCRECGDMWPKTLPAQGDPSVLALCDEVEALRARVPEVLREWPKAAEDAPGEWAWFTSSRLVSVGVFHGVKAAAFRTRTGEWYERRDFKPGEFFVRCP
jgi:hypothetical protein